MEINKPISVIIVLVITVVLFSLFVFPKYQESKSMEVELVQKQLQYESRVDYYLKLSDILNKIEQNQDALGKINSALPSDFSLAPIVYFIDKKSEESGLIVKSITFSQQQNELEGFSNQNIKRILFKVDLSGSYDGLKKFLSSVEKSSRLFEVSSISFSTGQLVSPKSSKVYEFSLSLQTHTY